MPTPEPKRSEVLNSLMALLAEHGATADRIVDYPDLMDVLGASNGVHAVELLKSKIGSLGEHEHVEALMYLYGLVGTGRTPTARKQAYRTKTGHDPKTALKWSKIAINRLEKLLSASVKQVDEQSLHEDERKLTALVDNLFREEDGKRYPMEVEASIMNRRCDKIVKRYLDEIGRVHKPRGLYQMPLLIYRLEDADHPYRLDLTVKFLDKDVPSRIYSASCTEILDLGFHFMTELPVKSTSQGYSYVTSTTLQPLHDVYYAVYWEYDT
jgi:hypothetical protein